LTTTNSQFLPVASGRRLQPELDGAEHDPIVDGVEAHLANGSLGEHHLLERRREAGEHLIDIVVGFAAVDELDSVVIVEPADRDRLDVVVRHGRASRFGVVVGDGGPAPGAPGVSGRRSTPRRAPS
jgi:hypothetical protein